MSSLEMVSILLESSDLSVSVTSIDTGPFFQRVLAAEDFSVSSLIVILSLLEILGVASIESSSRPSGGYSLPCLIHSAEIASLSLIISAQKVQTKKRFFPIRLLELRVSSSRSEHFWHMDVSHFRH